MDDTGLIVILSYPDTFVRQAYGELSSKIAPFFGVGGKDKIQAGHAALLLVDKSTGQVNYYDFGRYITSEGYGRVRSKETDPELYVPIKAVFKNGVLSNLKAILVWLESNPTKTHGDGRLVASVSDNIALEKANNYITKLIFNKEIPYGAFVKNGSNCARFVTDTIIHSTNNKRVKNKLKISSCFTPSPIGNVIKGLTQNTIYSVLDGGFSLYENRSVLKEYKACFFNKSDEEVDKVGSELPDLDYFNLKSGTWLGGIGSGAWFNLDDKISEDLYVISRYDKFGNQDFKAVFKCEDEGFNFLIPFNFVHPTNCVEVFLEQNNKVFVFRKT